MDKIIKQLLSSEEPSIKLKTRLLLLGEDENSAEIIKLKQEVKDSLRVKSLLRNMKEDGSIADFRGVYDKWQGSHWILLTLADLGYPANDSSLYNMAKQVAETWLDTRYLKDVVLDDKDEVYKHKAVPIINGKYRICASIHGNALYSFLRLGFIDDDATMLKDLLIKWQWNDGGWNCDKNKDAKTSTFVHTLYAMRALFLYAKIMKDEVAYQSAIKAAEYFLQRQLFLRKTNNELINPDFIKLHYPTYWHYDILQALMVLADNDLIDDPRCQKALDLLESKRLVDGGFPSEAKYYIVSDELKLGADFVSWGGVDKHKMNEWVTVNALYVLMKAKKLSFFDC